ncbi:hypothetical protein F7725_012751 [Dissostichus mawsoni]|uniref:C2 domain-containing protein n=1 Tax=Dissostichus mawsoni TaxID=36200 RepID=A0A7J5YQG6_DISMA|nr:hypothetical protein F7725_012751 [Dissostichus mawsoni]
MGLERGLEKGLERGLEKELERELEKGLERRLESDPYVKFKIAGKEVFRSKTIHKNLNPVWDERVSLLVDTLKDPLYVFDYDFGLQDDFMGSAYLHLESLDVTLDLKDPQFPEHNLGSLDLGVTLSPKEGDMKDATIPKTLNLSGESSLTSTCMRNREATWTSRSGTKTLARRMTSWEDLTHLSKEQTHKLELPLEEGEGVLVLLVTLTASAAVSISDLSVNMLDDPNERHQIMQRYSLWRSFNSLKDVGVVQVKVIRAEGLMAADVTGKSDPFCVVELSNDRLQTHTVYKNLNPEWNKVFTFNVKDIHSVLEVTVYDEDRDRSADFLGKIQNGERKAYALKSKELTGPTKGVIFLEIDVIFNAVSLSLAFLILLPDFFFRPPPPIILSLHPALVLSSISPPHAAVKAGLRTLIPIEQKYIEEEPRVSKQLLLHNFNRVRRCIMFLINTGCFINSCFEWDSPQRSICAFLFVIVVWNFELYMIPLALLLPLQAVEDLLEDEDEDFDKDDKDSERKGFMNKLYAIQDVCISVQNALDEVASYGERIKNTFNWTVPFLSWLAIVAFGAATILIYYIPLRYIVLAWGVNKFTKKLRDPYTIDNNELLDFLSRVPSDVQYRELKLDPNPSPNKRKKNNPGR